MTGNTVFRWPDGAGWLVFSGGADAQGEVRAQVLGRARSDGGVAYIGLDDDDDDDVLEDMAELGAPTGYLVNVFTEDDDTIRKQLEDAAVIVIPDHAALDTLRSGLTGATLDGLRAAHARGAVVFIEGGPIRLFGEVYVGRAELVDGFGWLEGAFLLPSITTIRQSDEARDALENGRARIAVGIGIGSALVLGPQGEVEVWGSKQVTIALGGVQS